MTFGRSIGEHMGDVKHKTIVFVQCKYISFSQKPTTVRKQAIRDVQMFTDQAMYSRVMPLPHGVWDAWEKKSNHRV